MTCPKSLEMLGKEARPEGAGNTDEPLDIGHCKGVSAMPDYVGNIGSTESAIKR